MPSSTSTRHHHQFYRGTGLQLDNSREQRNAKRKKSTWTCRALYVVMMAVLVFLGSIAILVVAVLTLYEKLAKRSNNENQLKRSSKTSTKRVLYWDK